MNSPACMMCNDAERDLGVLCARCAARLDPAGLCPEQIRSLSRGPEEGRANAWLIDGFGWPHTITLGHEHGATALATIGRAPANVLAIAEATVSIEHAELEHRERTGGWFLVDAESENGTFVGDERVSRRFPLESGDVLSFGRRVKLLFVSLEPDQLDAAGETLRWLRAQTDEVRTRSDAGDEVDLPLRVSAATEGGAICSSGEARVQLSELEYELIVLLWQRWRDDGDAHESARGFVPSAQLIDALSFKSETPTNTNLRVLVRKVRRKLAECEPPVDLIESRKGLGYRIARELIVD